MGKTTLYHPVSLHVIRGAAEYCGWQFSRIEQLSADPERGSAHYKAEVVQMPRGAIDWPLATIRRQLQHCFTDDIVVTTVMANSEGWMSVRLAVHLQVEDVDQTAEVGLPEVAAD